MQLCPLHVDGGGAYVCLPNCCFIFSLPKLEGKTNEEAMDNVRARLWSTMKANWCLWPVAQVTIRHDHMTVTCFLQSINFKFIPVAHQLNFVLIVSLGWASYLSWAGGKQATDKESEISE